MSRLLDRGVLGEFATAEALLAAAETLRKRGVRLMDAFTPFPVKGLDDALGMPRSSIAWIIGPIGLLSAGIAYLIQWYTNGVDYPINVGGRPPHAPPAFVPITFETGVLGASVLGLIVFMILARLPELSHPVLDVPGIERATIDRFWLGVDARDPSFGMAADALRELGAVRVVEVSP